MTRNPYTLRFSRESDYYVDDIYAFFQNCYHLKDWIKHDATAPAAKAAAVETYVKANPCLLLCADLCNGLKHLVLKNPRSGAVPVPKGRVFGLNLGENTISVQFTIEHNGVDVDTFTLATECVEVWRVFMG